MAKPDNLNGGRPLIEIDEALLERLTKLHLSKKIISDILQVSIDTLDRRFAVKMEQWQAESKGKIASVLFDEAVNKREPWALKALSQKHLDYSDKSEVKSEMDINMTLADKMAKARERAGKKDE